MCERNGDKAGGRFALPLDKVGGTSTLKWKSKKFFRFSFAVYSVCTTFAVEKRYRTATIRSGYSSIKIRKPGRTLLPMAGHNPILYYLE